MPNQKPTAASWKKFLTTDLTFYPTFPHVKVYAASFLSRMKIIR